ncbi:MAG: hypothetical protein EON59_05090 [Alphaproteobacteria bacterium]|nr:MAG: hypothetical protein EON59_05090 [Alphaproteobacteria bacterium]
MSAIGSFPVGQLSGRAIGAGMTTIGWLAAWQLSRVLGSKAAYALHSSTDPPGSDDVAKCVAKAGLVVTALWGIVTIGGCSTDRTNVIEARGSHPLVRLRGVFHSGEYAYFETSDRRAFDLRLPNPRDQRRIKPFIPMSFGSKTICAALRISGKIAGNANEPGRRIFLVSQIHEARRIPCR